MIRFPIAAVLAVALMVSLFWFLWVLITGGHGFTNVRPAVQIEFTPLRHDTSVETKREMIERPKPQQVPQVPEMAHVNFDSGQSSNFNMSVDANVKMGGISISGGSDRDVVPLVRINPDYPRRAQERGVTGWVQFEFTITAAGTVKDVKVIDSDPKGVFEDAATKAILRWKYNPKVEEGRPVERRGVQVVLRFDLEK